MSYSLIYTRSYDDHANPFLYVEMDQKGEIIEEPWDNGLNRHVSFEELNLTCSGKTELWYKDAPCDLYVTDSRLIFRRRSMKRNLKFNGSLVDYGVDAMFKKSADKKVDGLIQIGHLRYEWLFSIGYIEKLTWSGYNRLYFRYLDQGKPWDVLITFKGNMDVRFLANEILHSACRYRERMTDDKGEAVLRFLEQYKTDTIPSAQDPKKNLSTIQFPHVFGAGGGEQYRPPLG